MSPVCRIINTIFIFKYFLDISLHTNMVCDSSFIFYSCCLKCQMDGLEKIHCCFKADTVTAVLLVPFINVPAVSLLPYPPCYRRITELPIIVVSFSNGCWAVGSWQYVALVVYLAFIFTLLLKQASCTR